MGTAIDLLGAVYTTDGGTRYHAAEGCHALANGRDFHTERAGYPGLEGLYDLRRRSTPSAVQHSFTACRVCVPPALALPATGETFGHRPVPAAEPGQWPHFDVCARCGWNGGAVPVPWPCTSAVVLGLAPRGGEA